MTAFFIKVLGAFTLLLGLSGCYPHKANYSSGAGHTDLLPKLAFLAGADGKSAVVMKKEERGYSTTKDEQRIMLMPINSEKGHYWAQVLDRNKKGELTHTSIAVEIQGARVALISATSFEEPTSAEHVERLIRKDFANPKKTEIVYEVIDLGTAEGEKKATAFIEAMPKKKDQKKPAQPDQSSTVAPKQSGQFHFVEEKDVMTGKTKQFIFGFPEGGEVGKAPYIRLGCYGAGDQYPTGLTMNWGTSLRDVYPDGEQDAARVTVRLGNNAPMELGMSVSQNFAETYQPDAGLVLASNLAKELMGVFAPGSNVAKTQWNWSQNTIHRAFRTHDQIAIRGYPRSGSDVTMVFDTKGFKDVLRNFSPHCQRV